jgi:hypothetical protein
VRQLLAFELVCPKAGSSKAGSICISLQKAVLPAGGNALLLGGYWQQHSSGSRRC